MSVCLRVRENAPLLERGIRELEAMIAVALSGGSSS
jgi:hypothetical protein